MILTFFHAIQEKIYLPHFLNFFQTRLEIQQNWTTKVKVLITVKGDKPLIFWSLLWRIYITTQNTGSNYKSYSRIVLKISQDFSYTLITLTNIKNIWLTRTIRLSSPWEKKDNSCISKYWQTLMLSKRNAWLCYEALFTVINQCVKQFNLRFN